MTAAATRQQVLARATPDDIADLLASSPRLLEMLRAYDQPRGPQGRAIPLWQRARPDVDGVVEAVGQPRVLAELACSLDRLHFQLVGLAVWHGGCLTRDQALHEVLSALAEGRSDNAEPIDTPTVGAALDQAADRLERLLLATRSPGWLHLRGDVLRVLVLPGSSARPALMAETSAQLAEILRRLRVADIPARKDHRVDRLEAFLRDPQSIAAVLDQMPSTVRAVFDILVKAGAVALTDLGVNHIRGYSVRLTPALSWLVDHGLAGVDPWEGDILLWQDVLVGLRGRFYEDWSLGPPPTRPQPLDATTVAVPPALRLVDAVLDAWGAQPAPALANGGVGVRAIRALAKSAGVEAATMGLVVHLASELELIAEERPAAKRGRSQPGQWLPTTLAAAWRGASVALRWALLVQAWREVDTVDESQGLPERLVAPDSLSGAPEARAAILALLQDLPAGVGITVEELTQRVRFARPANAVVDSVDGVVAAARVLGLVPAAGPIGLTAAGRTVLEDPQRLAAALPATVQKFTVQADRSVMVPPELDPEIAARVDRYTVRESGVVHRLDADRLATAMDGGETADDIVAFLGEHATAPIAQNVAYFITDLGRRHGRLRTGAASSYLRCDDPAVLAAAAAVKPARLRLIAPTVAISSLPRAKVLTALRAKGLLPVAEDADGELVLPSDVVADRRDAGLPPLLGPDHGPDLYALAKTILSGGPCDDAAGPVLQGRIVNGRIVGGPWPTT